MAGLAVHLLELFEVVDELRQVRAGKAFELANGCSFSHRPCHKKNIRGPSNTRDGREGGSTHRVEQVLEGRADEFVHVPALPHQDSEVVRALFGDVGP